jgi:hypothetical protein
MKHLLATLALGALLLAPPLHAQPSEPQRYTPGEFNAIEIQGSAEIRFEQGDTDEVFVNGDVGMQERVQLRLRNNVLRIDSAGAWKFWNSRRLQVLVRSRQLSRLTISGSAIVQAPAPVRGERLVVSISGSGLARFEQLDVGRLEFSASGSGDADMAGRARDVAVNITGRSDFRGENLLSRRARVSISGVGDVKLWTTEDLMLTVSGMGQVEYWGNPKQLHRSTHGVATVVDRGAKQEPR